MFNVFHGRKSAFYLEKPCLKVNFIVSRIYRERPENAT